jgi:hypothetical protein
MKNLIFSAMCSALTKKNPALQCEQDFPNPRVRKESAAVFPQASEYVHLQQLQEMRQQL